MPGSGVAHLWEVDRGRRISEFDWGQAGLQSEFQGSQGYTEKYCLRRKKKKKQASKQASKQANKQTNSRQTTIYIYRKHVLPVDLPGSWVQIPATTWTGEKKKNLKKGKVVNQPHIYWKKKPIFVSLYPSIYYLSLYHIN